MGKIERHQGREAVAPVGNMIQRCGIGGFVGIKHLDIGTDGAGIGERQADFEAEMGGRIIERGNLQGGVSPGDADARFLDTSIIQGIIASRRGVAADALPLDAVGRQPRQPQAEDAPSLHGKGTHHNSIP